MRSVGLATFLAVGAAEYAGALAFITMAGLRGRGSLLQLLPAKRRRASGALNRIKDEPVVCSGE